jgi:tetratricopeptide (TPR) repeat protein
MNAKPPADRRKFANEWDEINYLYEKLLYWLYRREDTRKARAYAGRLERLLSRVAAKHEAIFGEECWSLVYEAKGDLRNAIKHRESEIRLIRRLHEITRNAPDAEFALKNYGDADLSDRMDLLAVLYHDAGKIERAIELLRESKRFCATRGIPFDGQDLLDDYLAEQKQVSRAG